MCAKKRGGKSSQSNKPTNKPVGESEFRQAMLGSGVEPIEHNQVVHHTLKKPVRVMKNHVDTPPIAEDRISDDYEPNEHIQAGDILSFCQSGIQKRVFRDLRRGRYRLVDELDLHGLTVKEAKRLLLQYLMQAEQFDKTCVKVIHGKGRRSETGEPVLKKKVAYWLRVHHRVLAYYSTVPADGGTGAVYVLLKRVY